MHLLPRPSVPTSFHTQHRLRSSLSLLRLSLVSGCAALLGGCFIGAKPVHKEVRTLAPVETAVVVPSAAAAASEARGREARMAAAAVAAAAAAVVEQSARTPPPPAFIDNLPTSIYFDNDAYLVAPQFESLLSQHAANLKADRRLRLQIRAYTDPKGGADYNRALAQMRATTVAKALGSLGVDRAQLEMQPHGAERSTRGAMATDARSRRVELVYLR